MWEACYNGRKLKGPRKKEWHIIWGEERSTSDYGRWKSIFFFENQWSLCPPIDDVIVMLIEARRVPVGCYSDLT